mmetsp:Transcript_23322/g.27036  ORF Transcript_23322/g.27036 Transcript_23322/m.27036 type:complete len:90 (-) Transcript_23322:89-358(-)
MMIPSHEIQDRHSNASLSQSKIGVCQCITSVSPPCAHYGFWGNTIIENHDIIAKKERRTIRSPQYVMTQAQRITSANEVQHFVLTSTQP